MARSLRNRSAATELCADIFSIPGAEQLNLKGTDGMREGTVYGVIGTLLTEAQRTEIELPAGASAASYEAIVAIPEEVFLAAARHALELRGELPPAQAPQA
jgi:hypothetical protein